MALINFTVKYDALSTLLYDLAGDDTDLAPLTGTVTFTPQLPHLYPAMAPDYSPRPSAVSLMPRVGVLDVDGQLKNRPGGTVGLRLAANDPALDLDRLPYKVSFDLTSAEYQDIVVDELIFDAPASDIIINLMDVFPAPGLAVDLTTITPSAWITNFLASPGPDAVRSLLGLTCPVFIQQADPETTHPTLTGNALWYVLDGSNNIVDVRVRAS